MLSQHYLGESVIGEESRRRRAGKNRQERSRTSKNEHERAGVLAALSAPACLPQMPLTSISSFDAIVTPYTSSVDFKTKARLIWAVNLGEHPITITSRLSVAKALVSLAHHKSIWTPRNDGG
ncbi:hypothetical protein J3458_003237 [Metarhizium acridum]|uniref:uncharacterized protein n=1 Tax=Metarhizium acridum TaxID=92637 RepID=UPI001C6C2858|nr:hypothetical protein J3458_003237 [Metarhizium acridum]